MTLGSARIGAVVLGAGRSQRMGQAKLSLSWGATTVIGQVVGTLVGAGVEEIVVVTGSASNEIEQALSDSPARIVFNRRYAEDFMLLTLQAGVAALPAEVDAFLAVLGDQPQMQAEVVRAVIQTYLLTGAWLVVPSHAMRRGHPWLAARPLWGDLLSRTPPQTPRRFLNDHANQIEYVAVENDSILRDLDTREDYERERPRPD